MLVERKVNGERSAEMLLMFCSAEALLLEDAYERVDRGSDECLEALQLTKAVQRKDTTDAGVWRGKIQLLLVNACI